MRKSLLTGIILLIGLLLFSCKKTNSDTVSTYLEGTWKMIIVTNNATHASLTKPSSIQGDVIITFVSNSTTKGTLTGKTPTNSIWPSEYTVGPRQTISIPVLAMTKVGETSWGEQFADNIRDAQQYSFKTGGRLNIKTTNKTLTFKKL